MGDSTCRLGEVKGVNDDCHYCYCLLLSVIVSANCYCYWWNWWLGIDLPPNYFYIASALNRASSFGGALWKTSLHSRHSHWRGNVESDINHISGSIIPCSAEDWNLSEFFFVELDVWWFSHPKVGHFIKQRIFWSLEPLFFEFQFHVFLLDSKPPFPHFFSPIFFRANEDRYGTLSWHTGVVRG